MPGGWLRALSKALEKGKRFHVPRRWPDDCIMCWEEAKVGVGYHAWQRAVGTQ